MNVIKIITQKKGALDACIMLKQVYRYTSHLMQQFSTMCPRTMMKYQTNQLGLFLLIVRSCQLEDWSVGRARKVCVDESVHDCKTWNYIFVNHLSNFL
jgi:hypothetical protein